MLKRLSFIIVVLLGFLYSARAQDPHFTQFYANQLYLNPAFAGSDKCPRANLNYRNQWPKLGSGFVTYSASYDQHVDWLEGGVGLHLMQDVQGDKRYNSTINTTYANLMYSYAFKVNDRFFIRGGFQASYIYKHLQGNYIYPDQIDPIYGPIFETKESSIAQSDTKGFFDFSVGVLGYTGKHYFGFAVHHLTKPQESYRDNSDARRLRKYTVHYGTRIPIEMIGFKKGDLYISPNIIYQQQGNFQQINLGFYFNRKSIVGGFWVRQNLKFQYDAFIMMLGYIRDDFRISYSYDLTVSKLRNATLGSHEISLGYTFGCREKKRKYNVISCPAF